MRINTEEGKGYSADHFGRIIRQAIPFLTESNEKGDFGFGDRTDVTYAHGTHFDLADHHAGSRRDQATFFLAHLDAIIAHQSGAPVDQA